MASKTTKRRKGPSMKILVPYELSLPVRSPFHNVTQKKYYESLVCFHGCPKIHWSYNYFGDMFANILFNPSMKFPNEFNLLLDGTKFTFKDGRQYNSVLVASYSRYVTNIADENGNVEVQFIVKLSELGNEDKSSTTIFDNLRVPTHDAISNVHDELSKVLETLKIELSYKQIEFLISFIMM